ncbi:MAG: type VI secretion system protein TssL [Pseudomonas sp.]|nr:type VI secretion system protein TssL [Pseudomonas sp.]
MTDEEEAPAGIPAWVMTFADLMSLLMCFFVLLLSFSEIDAMRFKQIAGELSKAFGVQRDVPALEVPMGTSAVFDKFSPGKPEPTPLDQVRQQTTTQDPQLDTLRGEVDAESEKAKQAQEQLKESSEQLQQILKEELQAGRMQLLEENRRIILRVEEKGSFPSGSAELTHEFEDLLMKISDALVTIPGELTVEGHTDNIPISTARFNSNWDLSASRASAVTNTLLFNPQVAHERLSLRGYADTKPRVANDTPENRAMNRRVEIIIDQSGSDDQHDEQLRSLLQGGEGMQQEMEVQPR